MQAVGVYEQQQRDRARALKAKFYGPVKVKPKLQISAQPKPEWMTKATWFDQQVRAYKRKMEFEERVRNFCMSQSISIEGVNELISRKSLKEICEEVLAEYPAVSLADVRGVRRTREVVAARHACIKAVFDERPDLSSPIIGKYFLRDHTVVLYAAGRLTHRKSQANEERNRNRGTVQASA